MLLNNHVNGSVLKGICNGLFLEGIVPDCGTHIKSERVEYVSKRRINKASNINHFRGFWTQSKYFKETYFVCGD